MAIGLINSEEEKNINDISNAFVLENFILINILQNNNKEYVLSNHLLNNITIGLTVQ